MPHNIVLVGEEADPHVRAVTDATRAKGATPILLNAELLATLGFSFDGQSFRTGDRCLQLDSPARGWLRRFLPERWRDSEPAGTRIDVERSARMELLFAVVFSSSIQWLTSFHALDFAENKAVQYRRAMAAGAPVPWWIVTSDPAQLDFGHELIAKPLGPGEFYEADGTRRIVFTHPLPRDPEWRGWELLSGAPFIVQRRIQAAAHLRITTVADQAWSCVLERTDELDWRRDPSAHDAFVSAPDVDWVAQSETLALNVAVAMGAGFTAQDWIWDGQKVWFLDLNPAGQWLFLPKVVAKGVTNALANWLVS